MHFLEHGSMIRFFRHSSNQEQINRICEAIRLAARDPVLFTDYGIEDSLEGRFEALALHGFLVLRRLSGMEPPGPAIAQDLTDAIFASLDRAMREAGVGDISVPKHMKRFARAFLGRAAAYDQALRNGSGALAQALSRNVYGGRRDAARLVRYAEAAAAALANAPLDVFLKARIPFPEPSAIS